MNNKNYKEVVEAELQRHGIKRFFWQMRGKHEACVYELPDKRTGYITTGCTPSDHRALLNKRTDVRREMRRLGIEPLPKTVKVRPETCRGGGMKKRAPRLDELHGDNG